MVVVFKMRCISRYGLRCCLKVLGRLRFDSRICSSSSSVVLNFFGMGLDMFFGFDSYIFFVDGSIVYGSWGVLSGRCVDVVGIMVSGFVFFLEVWLKDCVWGRDVFEKMRLVCKYFDDCWWELRNGDGDMCFDLLEVGGCWLFWFFCVFDLSGWILFWFFEFFFWKN